jgi:SAM-dependent methyltransferase
VSALLEEPALRGIELGSARWFQVQRDLITQRPLVKRTYDTWYSAMLADAASVPSSPGRVLELGSGANYVKLIDPSVITSDVVAGSDMVVDGQALPFGAEELRAIFLTHVFHHVPEPERFLDEAIRTLVPGGVVAFIDVAHTPLARLLFGKFHPEAYDGSIHDWKLDPSGPYGGANQAMSWVVFVRDKARFEARFPALRVECVEFLPWFGYLISGGLTRRNLVPSAAVPVLNWLDRATTALNPLCALHWHIRIRKVR